MSTRPASAFAPPSDSFWARLIDTPLTDLLRGKVTGRLNPRRLIARAKLPAPLAAAVWQTVMAGGRSRYTRVDRAMEDIAWCRQQLSSGRSAEDVAAVYLERVADTALFAGLVGIGKLRTAVLNSELPASLLRLVHDVTSATRLWTAERADLARELINHFSEGQAAGKTAEELQAAFGGVPAAARLIRRAKRRNRPLAWQVWHRSLQAVLATALLTIVAWTVLLVRFHSARPVIARDFVAEIDSASRRLPAAERAWPLYRRGLEQFIRLPAVAGDDWQTLESALEEGPENARWPDAQEYLQRNQKSLALFLEAADRKEFGYIFRDAANDPWLLSGHQSSSAQMYPPDEPLLELLLPHIQDTHWIRALLAGAAQQAAAAGDSAEALRATRARLHLIDQIWRSSEFSVTDAVAAYHLQSASEALGQLLSRYPQLFSDEELQGLAHELAAACGGELRLRTVGQRRFVLDFLQRTYSDDGRGNGRFTAAGWQELQRMANVWERSTTQPAWSPVLGSGKRSWWDDLRSELIGSGVSTFIPDRREMQAEAERLLDLHDAELALPYWQRGAPPVRDELERIEQSATLRQRYLPLLVLISPLVRSAWLSDHYPELGASAARDAGTTAIALELFRRREGAWPARLDQLVPRFLPRLPIDPFDGQALRYRLDGNRPLLYSVGPNKTDDEGMPTAGSEPGWKAPDGDWRLWP